MLFEQVNWSVFQILGSLSMWFFPREFALFSDASMINSDAKKMMLFLNPAPPMTYHLDHENQGANKKARHLSL